MKKDGNEIRKRILSVCARLFLEQGYSRTSVSQITKEANVTRGTYQNLFHTKDSVLMEFVVEMFGNQFGTARDITGEDLPPVYSYAVETAIQLTLTELNENLREIYIEAYTVPETAEYIYLSTTAELRQIFGQYLPGSGESDFYELEIGSSGLMRNYMAKKCDVHFPLERKLERFLTSAMRIYRVPEDEQQRVTAYIAGLDMKAIAAGVMQKLFLLLEMKFEFTLTKPEEAK